MPFTLHSFNRAILHVDGDSFFASCETALNPSLRGKPVVTGKERGIASSMSYEAKRRGVTRGMPLHEIRKVCPEAIILPSDYETYSLFSKRMFEIVRRYTPLVEEYSIDECFADLSGLRSPLKMSYEDMARSIKLELEAELGMTFSVGLAPTKVLAKAGSKWNKPSGLTLIPGNKIEMYLEGLPIENIWGIGSQTTNYLKTLGVETALQYANKSREWIETHMHKPYQEIWYELRGTSLYAVNGEEKREYQSISKTKTFAPPSKDQSFIFSQLSKNVENACIKARRHNLAAKKIFFFLKTQQFRFTGFELTLNNSLAIPNEIIRLISEDFNEVYRPGTYYRATGVVLMNLLPQDYMQEDLFGAVAELSRWRRVYATVDELDSRFGKHTVFLGSTLSSMKKINTQLERNTVSHRATTILKGEAFRQRLNIPLLGDVV